MKNIKCDLKSFLMICFTVLFAGVSFTNAFAAAVTYTSTTDSAAKATFSYSGDSTVEPGATFVEKVMVTDISSGYLIQTYGANVGSNNTSCVSVVSIESTNEDVADFQGTTKINYNRAKGFGTSGNYHNVTFKAGSSSCTADIYIGGGSDNTISFLTSSFGVAGMAYMSTAATKTITVASATPSPSPSPSPSTSPTTKSNDSSLSKLSPSAGTLSPTFSSGTTNYTLTVPSSTMKIDFTTATGNSKATVAGTSCDVSTSNTTTCKIIVTAEDGSTSIYSVSVTKDSPDVPNTNDNGSGTSTGKTTPSPSAATKSNNDYLKTLIAHEGDLSPSFSRDTTDYKITVPYDVTSLSLSAIAEESSAKVEISGNSDFEVGATKTVAVTVTAEDGSQKVYHIAVTRSDKKADNDLKSLSVDGYEISPKFDKDTDKYYIKVPYGTTEIKVDALPESSDSTVEIIGNKNLSEGNNIVLVKVTDKYGFVHYYEIDVAREAEPTILGIRRQYWWIFLLLVLLLLLLIALIWWIYRKLKERREVYREVPTINFAPEINVGSRNGTDDDEIQYAGSENEYGSANLSDAEHPLLDPIPVQNYIEPADVVDEPSDDNLDDESEPYQPLVGASEEEKSDEQPYDLYDDVVTKDELIDALREVKEEHNTDTLNMLLKQEDLNREKEELREREAAKKREMERSEEDTSDGTISISD